MSDVSVAKLRAEVAIVLENADLALVSSKKVREQVQQNLNCDLSSRKKEFDTIVMDYINEQHENQHSKQDKMDEDDDEDEAANNDDDESVASSESEFEAPKRQAKATARKAAAPKKKNAKTAEGGGAAKSGRKSTGFTKAINLSPELSALMGSDSLPRHEVVKNMWAIIKERNLYDPKNKQYAICDDELRKIMKVKRFRTFGMLKHLKPHFLA